MNNLRTSAAYRIAFTYAAAFAAAILTLGVAVYVVADIEFHRQRDAMIAGELEDLAQEGLGDKLIAEIERREAWSTRHAFSYALFDRTGQRIAGRFAVSQPQLYSATLGFTTFESPQGIIRANGANLPDGSRLIVGLDSVAIEAIDRTILTLFAGAFVVVLVFGAVGALFLGRYLARRLAAVSTTADEIIAGDFDQRIAVGSRGDEFDRLATALNAMLDRIAGLMENLRQVSSDVAHDLRTPLLRLRNELEKVGRVDGAAERAIEQGDRLLHLFAAILRIAEVEGGDLKRDFKLLDLSTLVEDLTEDFEPALADSGHELACDVAPSVTVRGDRELLAQAVSNILDNARIHTPRGTRIDMSLAVAADRARLTISDNGPGVSDKDRAAILRRFFRTEVSRTTQGNGLGLSLVSAVAAAHGGAVEVNDAHPGLALTIDLPRVAA